MKLKDYSNNNDCHKDRIKCHIITDSNPEYENYVEIKNSCIEIVKDNNSLHTIPYNRISNITLSMCSRIYNQFPRSTNLLSFVKGSIKSGSVFTVPVNTLYSFDLDIEFDGVKVKIESYTFTNFNILYETLTKNNVPITDPYNIIELSYKYNDPVLRQNYFNKEFPKLAKTYNLDNPRGYISNVYQ